MENMKDSKSELKQYVKTQESTQAKKSYDKNSNTEIMEVISSLP